MTAARTLTRTAFLAFMTGAATIALAPQALAARNPDAEIYVDRGARSALEALANGAVSAAQRHQTFYNLMARFADMPRIANFVLGRYGPQMRADPALWADWNRTFQEYAIAIYEANLENYSSSSVRVTDSTERTTGRDVIVQTEMTPAGSSRPLRVQWRLLHGAEAWRVVDVSLILEGNEIWLAQQQQRDFLALLDANQGDLHALIDHVRASTAHLRATARR